MSISAASSPSVLIVGAGPAGLVLALALRQNGIIVRIIEKDTGYHVGQRGAGVMPRTLEIYNLLGVLPDILRHSAAPLSMQSYELESGKGPLKTWRMSPIEEPTPSRPWPNAVMIGQSRTEAVLRTHLEALGCAIELGTRLLSFEQYTDYVDARIIKTKGAREVQEIVRVNWLVGADGARGIVRKQLGLSFLGETRDERFAIADVHVRGLDMHHIHMFGGGPSGTVLIWPSERKDGDLMTLYAYGPDADYAKITKDYSAFKTYVENKIGRSDIVLGESTWLTEFRPNIRMVDTFQKGNAFVVGDAGHVHSIMGGQGLNTSIQDSFNLAWKLALVEKRVAAQALLTTYTEERLPVVAEALNLTTALLNKTVSAEEGDESTWKRGDSLDQLGVNYRWSSLVVDERAAISARDNASTGNNPYAALIAQALCGGDRAPDAPQLLDIRTNQETSLFQVFGSSYHTVLFFCASPSKLSEVPRLLMQYPPELISVVYILPSTAPPSDYVNVASRVLHDCKSHAYENYHVLPSMPTLVVVRPDGVIGAIVLEEKNVETYLCRVFSGEHGSLAPVTSSR